MDQSGIEPGTVCLLSWHFSALHHRGQLAFSDFFTGVLGSLALGIQVTLSMLDYTKCGAYKQLHTEK